MGRPRASREARGYGYRHRKAREQHLAAFIEGQACVRCGHPIWGWQHKDLDHTDDRTSYRGLAHRSCNRRAGANKRNQQAKRSARRSKHSRRW